MHLTEIRLELSYLMEKGCHLSTKPYIKKKKKKSCMSKIA